MSFAIVGLNLSAAGNAAETAITIADTPTAALTAPIVTIPKLSSVPPVPVLPADTAVSATAVTNFTSLAAAVAAHDGVTATPGIATPGTDADLHCLAGAIYYEAKGEPLHGQLGVAEVIINRAKSGRFASNVCSVVTQRGQFSFVRGGRIPAIDQGRAAYRTALAVARVAVNKLWDSPASNALYFNARRAPAAGLRRVASIGNHIFYR